MRSREDGFVVRSRFSPPSIEPVRVVSRRSHNDGVLIEVVVTPRFPFRTGETVRMLLKSSSGRIQASANFVCWTGDAALFSMSNVARVELRESERVTTELPARVRQLGGDLEATVADMSRGGLRVLVAEAPTSPTIVLAILADELHAELLCRVLAVREEGPQFSLHVAVDRVIAVSAA